MRFANVVHEFDIDDAYESAIYPKLKAPGNTLICVSLTPEYEKDHNHYKIAAAFLEPPE